MKTGKITAKLRDAVPVCLMVNGEEVKRYKNIELEYKAAPSFAYEFDKYTVDKEGTLTGPENPALIESLKEQGFIAAE